MLNTSGLTAEVVDDIHSTEWTKLLGAVPGLIMSLLTRLELYEMWMNRHLASMWVQLLKETAEVAKKDGVRPTMIPGMDSELHGEIS
jgi:ketopantoate reductase